jgi:hypothetical protein
VLWRRTKLGLRMTPADAHALAGYLARDPTHSQPPPAPRPNPLPASGERGDWGR